MYNELHDFRRLHKRNSKGYQEARLKSIERRFGVLMAESAKSSRRSFFNRQDFLCCRKYEPRESQNQNSKVEPGDNSLANYISGNSSAFLPMS